MSYENPLLRIARHPLRLLSVGRMVLLWMRVYFTTQQQTDASVAEVVELPVDARVPPDPEAIYPYLFASVYTTFTGWYMLDRVPRKQYRRGYAAFHDMILRAKDVFVARPTRMRDRARLSHPLVVYTQLADGPTNCFPSLHVGITMLAYQIIKDGTPADDPLLTAMRRACVDICRSTMKTKQHSMADVVGGLRLARTAYEGAFDGPYEDLLAELLPELAPDELEGLRVVAESSDDLAELLDRLLNYLGSLQ